MLLPDQEFLNKVNLLPSFRWDVYFLIYLISFIPVYGGAIIMIVRMRTSLTFAHAVKFVKNFFKTDFRTFFSDPLFSFGFIVFVIGWLLPYFYILAYLNLPLFIKVPIFFILILLLYAFSSIRKKNPRDLNVNYDIKFHTVINDHIISKKLWDIYDSSFRDLNERAPCRQSFHEEDFYRALTNKEVVKIVAYVKDKSIGLAMVSNEFSNSPWISEDFFRVRYPEEYDDNRIYYFMGIVIEERYRNLGLTVRMLRFLIDSLPKNILVGFDHSAKNNARIAKFPYLLGKRFINRKYLDSMDYYVAKFNK